MNKSIYFSNNHIIKLTNIYIISKTRFYTKVGAELSGTSG